MVGKQSQFKNKEMCQDWADHNKNAQKPFLKADFERKDRPLVRIGKLLSQTLCIVSNWDVPSIHNDAFAGTLLLLSRHDKPKRDHQTVNAPGKE